MIKSDNGTQYAEISVTTKIDNKRYNAVLFDFGDKEDWIPRSVMEDWPDLNKTGTALIAVWFVEKEMLV